jgi:FKBP-type peptidyl-prolyl cis-trans isomerase SlyD
MVIEPNAHVMARYVLRTRSGDVLASNTDDGGELLEYVHGYGTLVTGLEAHLAGMAAGETKTIELEPFEAFGDRDEELVFTVDRDEIPQDTNAGDEIVIESDDGGQFEARVIELGKGQAVLDANHPLAGLHVVFEVEVVSIREATESEIRAATGDLVQLGRKHSKPLE